MRLHMYLNETAGAPVPILFINHHQLAISECELDSLLTDILWIKECMSEHKARRYKALATKYKETSCLTN